MRPLRFVLLASALPLATVGTLGCDGGDDGDADSHDSHDSHHAGTDTDTGGSETHGHETGDTGDSEQTCATEDRDDDFAIGLSKTGEYVVATFVSANPAPPIKGDNTWTLEFEDLAGEPVEGLTIVAVPMMPDHGHGTPVNAEVTVMPTPGQYELSPVNLFMTGYWEITLELTLPEGETDTVMFGFCVE